MRAFQQYFPQMAKLIQTCPQHLAKKLEDKGLIAKKTLEKVNSSTGLTSLQKAEVLLRAVDTKNVTDDSENGESLKKFCKVLGKYQNLKQVSQRLWNKFGRLCVYHV